MKKEMDLPVWAVTNAWREIFTRIFEGENTQFNVTPEWLVNPATQRRLKLDLLYPDLGIAIRFEGLQGKQRRQRLSLEEETQQRVRDEARAEVCQAHGIQLVEVHLTSDRPDVIFRQLDEALSRAGQRARDEKQQRRLKAVRVAANTLARKIGSAAGLSLYADLWGDRQYKSPQPAQEAPPKTLSVIYKEGMEVEHTVFGPGVVLATAPSNGDTLVTVDFITAGKKTLAASLVGDKLMPR
jgi:hypothetical protein